MSTLTCPRASASPGSDSGPHFRLLVVDDVPSIHEDVRRVLTAKHAPDELAVSEEFLFGAKSKCPQSSSVVFDIDTASQGDEGIECVRRAVADGRPYSVAFVDMRMPPGKDGLQTMLAMWGIDPHLQVVCCSAYSDYSWEQMIATTGETDRLLILRKPFEPVEVVQLAHALTKKWELHAASRRRAENAESQAAMRRRELQERQALSELILANTTDLITMIDRQGRRIYHSPSYVTVLGYTAAELEKANALDQVHPDDQPQLGAALESVRASGIGRTVSYRVQHRDGSWKRVEARPGAIRGSDGSVSFLVIAARDVTDRS